MEPSRYRTIIALDIEGSTSRPDPVKAELRTMLRALKATPDPVILVVSGDIYSSVVRHGNGQLDKGTFRRLVTRQMADAHYAGWVR